MSAEMKKPPVAPKPKHALKQKPSPPPVAPKPDLVLASVVPATKKSKPTIAPKPKALRGSSVTEERPQCAAKTNGKSIEEHKGNCSENVRCRKETLDCNESPAYIIPTCSCNCDGSHKLENGGNIPTTQIVIERLENLENRKMCGQPTPCVRKGKKPCGQQVKLAKANQVILRASFLEDKVKDVLTQNVFSNGYKRENADKDLRKNVSCSPCKVKNEYQGPEGSLSSTEESACNQNDQNIIEIDGSHSSLHTDCKTLSNDKKSNGISLTDKSSTTDDGRTLGSPPRTLPPDKMLPVPKPRKLRTACLVRQDCIESTTEGNDYSDSFAVSSHGLFQHGWNRVDHSSKHGELCDKYTATVVPDPKSQKVTSSGPVERSEDENSDPFINSGLVSSKPYDSESENPSTTVVEDKRCSFIRCSSLSMSLPKQLKLIYEQLPANKSLDVSAEKKIADNIQAENSPRIAPKKPQRHSLPAAGLLKKAASEEQVEKLQDSHDEISQGGTAGIEGTRHLSARELALSSSFNIPKPPSEKPVWKLPHPILPFLGNPESLKTSSNNESLTPATKPRAKSLSSVDMDKVEKPAKDGSKKSSFKKFLNMKLSVCIIKSDFQRFLSRSSPSSDSAASDLPSCVDNTASPALDKKIKPTKVRSADSYSPTSQKKRQKHRRSECNTPNNHTSLSLDEENFISREKPLILTTVDLRNGDPPEYENICHYEEIPEYENLPFALISDKNECDATIYEVEDPGEAIHNYAMQKHVYHSEPSQENPDEELGIVHSDEEEIINSSDEDDFSSDSSKADLDHLVYKPNKGAGQKTKVYHITKEIMSSEKVFVDVLKLLHIDFRYAVAQASRHLGKPVIEDKILNQILYYLPQLYELNRDVLRELEERMSQWNEHQKIADIFVKKGPYLKMYSTYIREFDRNVALLDEQCKKNPGFAGVVKEFEMSPRCANLALKHYLLKPVQRIPQYRLLLTGTQNVTIRNLSWLIFYLLLSKGSTTSHLSLKSDHAKRRYFLRAEY
ncbi:hypothetical protein FKM82_012556 [Ascaphus truei]